MVRLSLFMTLSCIYQAESCLEVIITMTKIRYASTSTSARPRITSRGQNKESEGVCKESVR